MTRQRSDSAVRGPNAEALVTSGAVLCGVWLAAGADAHAGTHAAIRAVVHAGAAAAWCGALVVIVVLAIRALSGGRTRGRRTHGGESRGAAALVVVVATFPGWFLLAFGLGVRAHAGVSSAVVHDTSFVVVEGVIGSDGTPAVLRSADTRVLLHADEGVPPLGARVRVTGTLSPLRGDSDRLRRYHYERVTGSLRARDVETLDDPPPAVQLANMVRQRLNRAAGDLGDDRAGLLLGLLIGDDRRLGAPTRVAFRTAGMSHLVAVSGANLVLVMGAIGVVVTCLPLPRLVRVLGVATALGFYILVTRAEPSVVRAGMLAAVALGGTLLGVRRDVASVFVLAVIGLVLADPFLAASVGFQLSTVAAAGVLWMAPPVNRALATRFARGIARHRAAGAFLEAAAVTVGAQVAVIPVLAWHFGSMPGLAGAVNLVAVPVAAAITIGGAALAPVAVLAPVAFSALVPLLDALLGMAHAASDLPLASLQVGRVVAIVVVVAGVVARRAPVVGVGAAAAGIVAGALLAPVWPQCAGVSFLDVGQGDATLLRSTDGAVVLVDTGRSPLVLADLVYRAGIDHVDLLVLTHDDLDHVGGVPGLGEVAIGRVVVPDGMRWASAESQEVHAIITGRAPVTATRAGDRWVVGDVVVDVLHPRARRTDGRVARTDHDRARDDPAHVDPSGDDDGGDGEARDDNDDSVVLWVSVDGIEAALLADVGAGVQRSLVDDVGPADVVKVAHHGARSQDPDLAAVLDAPLSVMSVGRNRYGHPTQDALDMYGRHGHVRRTDEDGSVVVCRETADGPLDVHRVGYAAGP